MGTFGGERILLVEEDAAARTLLRQALERRGLDVLEGSNAVGGLRLVSSERPDAVLVDVALPGLNGSALIARMRALTDAPLMVVTEPRDENAAVEALRAGADDFLAKPFRLDELIARVEALLRRAARTGATRSRYFDEIVEVDFTTLEVRAAGTPVELTAQQLRLLAAFVRHPGEVLSPERLLKLAWDDDLLPRARVKLNVGYLRRTFRAHGVELPIETVRGFGYRYRP